MACIVVVEARYGSHHAPYTALNNQHNNGGYNYNYYSPCKGYQCNSNAGYLPSAYSPTPYSKQAAANRSPYGPYHSYAAKPAIYGGEKLYHYHGYTRHYPPPPLTYHPRKAAAAAAGNGNYHPRPAYGMRPVKALALAPAHQASKTVYSDYPNYPRAPARPYNADHSLYETNEYPRSPYNRQARPYRSHGHLGGAANYNGYSGEYNNGAPRYYNGRGNGHKSNSYKAYKTAY